MTYKKYQPHQKTDQEILHTIHMVAKEALDPFNVDKRKPHKRTELEQKTYALNAILNQTIDYVSTKKRV